MLFLEGDVMADYTVKGAILAVVVAAGVALVGSTQQPWWWCNTVGCKADAKPNTSDSGGDEGGTSKRHASQDEGPTQKPSSIEDGEPRMSDLLMETNFQGSDINNGETVADVRACQKLCKDNDECKAITYVFHDTSDRLNGSCWLKGGVPEAQHNPYMISSRKIT
jgi:hypothetical protein